MRIRRSTGGSATFFLRVSSLELFYERSEHFNVFDVAGACSLSANVCISHSSVCFLVPIATLPGTVLKDPLPANYMKIHKIQIKTQEN